MYKEARELAKLGKDIVIRLPIEPAGMRVARLLADDQVAICASGCHSAAQALLAAKANVAYVAPAVGPLDDFGSIGMDLVEQVIRIYDNYGFQTQILVSRGPQPGPRARRGPDGRGRRHDARDRPRAALPAPADRASSSRAAGRAVKVSPDRILYLSRVITRKLKDNMNLVQKGDDETVRRAVVRVLTETYKELDAIEEKVGRLVARRKNLDRGTRSTNSREAWKRSSASTAHNRRRTPPHPVGSIDRISSILTTT